MLWLLARRNIANLESARSHRSSDALALGLAQAATARKRSRSFVSDAQQPLVPVVATPLPDAEPATPPN